MLRAHELRVRVLVVLVASLLASSACGGDGGSGDPPLGAGPAQAPGVAAQSPGMRAEPGDAERGPQAEVGISAQEAKERGVFVAEFDARLAVASAGAGTSRIVTLTNAGQSPDRYVARVEPQEAGAVAPDEVLLEPGERAQLAVTVRAPLTVHVTSSGRGAVVAELPLP